MSLATTVTATAGVTDIHPGSVGVQDASVIARDDGTVLVEFWRPGYTERHEVVFKTSPDFCTDPVRLFEVVEAAIKKTDPKIVFRVLRNENRMCAEIVVTLDTLLGVERRKTQADVTVLDGEHSVLFKLQSQLDKLGNAVSGLKQDNEKLEERVHSLEETPIVVACDTQFSGATYCLSRQMWYSCLRCDELYLPTKQSMCIFGPVVASIQTSTIRVEFLDQSLPVFANRYASTLVIEGLYVPDRIDLSPLLATLPNVRTVVVKANTGTNPPTSLQPNIQYIFRAVGRESCPEEWRRVADGNTNVTMEYTGAL
jgi:hypothetical protein